jgi:hypothetical protein
VEQIAPDQPGTEQLDQTAASVLPEDFSDPIFPFFWLFNFAGTPSYIGTSAGSWLLPASDSLDAGTSATFKSSGKTEA